MRFIHYLIFLGSLAALLHVSHGCEVSGITNWNVALRIDIYDVFEGEIFAADTTGIDGVSATFDSSLNEGKPYYAVQFDKATNRFSIITGPAFKDYEEYETEMESSVTVTFNCVGGSRKLLVFMVNLTDTNNNDPLFRPDNVYEFTVVTPLTPGFRIGEIMARDIDLTTFRVEFLVIDNKDFLITETLPDNRRPKEFHALLTATNFIRSIPEPIEFKISATDFDNTGDESRTTHATVRIKSDGEFELPEEPVFSRTFYVATYTNNHEVVLQDTISLRQGYDEEVKFSLKEDPEFAEYFSLVPDGNEIHIRVDKKLPVELLRRNQILLVVQAERDLTSGASATVIIQLPEGRIISFAQAWYVGKIVEGTAILPPLPLTDGYDLAVQLNPGGDFSTYFKLTRESNNVMVTMDRTLPPEIIDENSFIILDVEASYPEAVTGHTTIVFELIKQPIIAPVFDEAFYSGQYSKETGLLFEQTIRLKEGFDESVDFDLDGDDSEKFRLVNRGQNSFTIELKGTEIARLSDRHQLVFSVVATKPDTTPGLAALVITLTGPIISFGQASYAGKIVEGSLQLPPLALVGANDLPVRLSVLPGAFSSYFTVARESNNAIVTLSPNFPPEMVEDNAFISLDIEASYPGAVSGFTAVILEVVKEPIVAPVFDQAYYAGQYSEERGLRFDQTIRLKQGIDDSVIFILDGDDSKAFNLDRQGQNSYTLSVVPSEMAKLSERHQLVFSVVATKPDTTPARAALVITLTGATISFVQASYAGKIVEGSLQLPPLALVGANDLAVRLSVLPGAFSSYFTVAREANNAIVTMSPNFPPEMVEENAFISLDIEASYPGAVSGFTAVILEVVKEPIVVPVFDQAYYAGQYSEERGLRFDQTIRLKQGFDDSVIFILDGDDSKAFNLDRQGQNSYTLSVVPSEMAKLSERHQLVFSVVATKPDTTPARAALVITLTDAVLSFERASYEGKIVEGSLQLSPLTIIGGSDLAVQVNFLPTELSQHFTLTRESNNVIIMMKPAIPPGVLENNALILLDIEASYPGAVSGFTTVVLEVVKEPIVAPVFDQAYYAGQYSEERGLRFDQTIRLKQGFDDSVIFILDGDDSKAFNLDRQGQNSYTLSVVPSEMAKLSERHQLVFSVVATKPDTTPARAALVITLTDAVLSFERASYEGKIVEGSLQLSPLTIIGGSDLAVQVNFLPTELSQHFTLTRESNNVIIIMKPAIPPGVLENNALILLDIEASYPGAVSGFTTVVLEVVKEPIEIPIFNEPYYIGQYSQDSGLEFDQTIKLAQGFDESVLFTLAGDDSEAFRLEHLGPNRYRLLIKDDATVDMNNRNKLVFSVVATKPNSISGRAAIIVALKETTTDRVLGFDRVNYLGSLTEDTVNLQPITLRDGFGTDVRFTLHGDLQQHFTHVEQGDSVFVRLEKPIPAQSLPENGIIILKIQASAPQTVPAVATIVLEVQHTETPPTPTLPDPVFAEPFYTATLISNNELESGTPISLAEGYDSSVILDLEGDGSQWFDLERSANSARLILRTSNPIPPSVVASREQLVFVVTAQRPESAVARATVIVTWREETTTDRVLGFDRVNYLGSLTEDTVNLQPITLRDGFGTDVRFTLHGDLQQHFTHVEQGDTVFVRLENPIPAQSLPENGIIILKIQASAPLTVPAVATIVLEVQHTETPPTPTLPDPVFAEPFYTATLISNNELESGTPISLAEGYDSSVILDLEGDGSQWFDLERSANSARLILRTSNPIPPSVVASREQLVFVVTAQRPESAVARATVIVTWREETTTDRVLGFDRVNYLGSLTEDTVNLQPITLRDGFGTDVRFTLHGDLQQHFTHVEQGDTVFVRLEKPIPAQSLPENGIIILKIQASAPQTVPAVATIVLEVQHTETPPTPTLPDPVFAEPFYTATLISNNELESGTPISLAEGYDSSVILDLEGDGSQWFDLERSANSARLILRTSNPIPPSVVASREQLVFVVTAQRPESAVARATVIVTWREETTTDRVLGFDRVNYLGSLTEDTVNLQPITLRDGFGTDVRFTLHGDLQQHFTHVEQGDTVFVRLEKPIPAQSLPENGIIILKIQASAPQTVPAVATIVLEVQHTETPPTPTLPDPVFAEPFYTATLISNNELESGTPISLAEGYDSSVILDLEGDGSQWFDLERSANSARLILRTSNPIPPSVVASREQLVFVVTAQRPESAVAQATVIVTWREETTTDRVLGFDRVNYLGSLTEDTVNLQPITLRDGFGTDVRFTLHGDLQQHFTHVEQGDSVFVRLEKPIPAQSLPENGIIILKIQASAPQTVPAVATIVLEVQHTETPPTPTLPDPVFAEPFYTATLISNNELESGTPISLAEGYDSSVILDLEGDGSQWFDLERSANSARLILRTSNPIPPSVVASREQLVFVVTAQRPESAVARATVIVTWREETTTDRVLGFDRVNYLGSLTEDTVNLQPITLRDGFGTDVRFTLHGDLQQHFTHVEQGDTVFVRLEKPIPAQSLPENGIIILKIQASAPQTVPAVATIVLEVQHTETPPTPTLPDPVFAEPFYTATLISNNELESGTPILLAEGYDSSVILDLEGDGSQWFDLERSANSARLILRTSNPIPPSVVASREQLVFVVTAQRPESAVARATVIVTWREETTTDRVLGFDRVNYLGSLTEDTVNLQPITLRDGFGTDVGFTLHGDLQQHFTHVEQGDSVFVRLEKPIPAQSLPENGIIILKIQASAPQTVPAVATIVLEVQHTETPPTPTLPDPVFAEPFYTATLISNNELESGTPISLAEGYDSSVILDLEGDGSQWFDLERSANSARLILRTSNPIPPSVVASREQLVFVVTAQRPESAVARATVIVTWREETTTDRVLGFDRVNYLGSLTEDTVNLQPITLRDGFGTDVRFTLHGDLQHHFTHVEQGDTVFVRLEKPIPAQSLPENGIIILKIQASAPQTVPAVATIVLEVQHTETPPTPTLPDPVFAEPFYTATLISHNELESGTPISLAEGYDSSVILDLEGDGSQWFDLERSANSARLILRTSNPIPPSVVASREQLVFVVTAQRPESAVARATVIVTWREETTTDRVLGFDRVNYLGSLTDDTVNLQPITLRDGFGTDVRFTLHGDLQQHFTHVEQGDSVFVRLEKPIPAQSLPENGIIILKIQASAPQTVPAVATIVLEVQHTETPPTPTLPDPVFAEPFYTATLISNNELESGTPISLAEGYDSSVILDLEGDGSQWFDLERSANSARLILRTSNPIPPSVVASREQLVFVVTAQRPESAVARATVIVTWREETTTDRVLGFDRVNYLGSLTEDTVNLQPITLRDGFGTDVRFTLHGDLQQHFTHVEQGDTVFVRLEKPIPAQSLPENGIIILKIQASAPQTVPAVATIVLEVQHTETPPTPTLPDPVFAEPFYTATLISNNELESGTPISLAEGYDSSVILDLEGDGSQWFDLERSANSARLILRTSNPIPPSVVASREQLVFVVTAQRPESAVARATVIVTWREETTTDRVLGFDRVNYLGSLTEDTVNLQPITLRDGFGTDVRFTLHGDLQQHFTHVEQGDSVFVRLEKPIPAQSLPENGIIILKIQASAPQTVPAVATIVLEVQHTETPPTPTLPDPVFAEPFYTATLISNNELESGTPISLAEGYDSSVILDLEGDGSQWFDLERSANSARLILRTSNPIPPSVVASREQLVFVVTAQRPESAVARATVIVTWREETTTDRVLGFDRVNYLGSLTDDTVNLQPITLRDGFGTDVRFTLHGDLQQHFTHVEQGDSVFVRLEKPIPAQSLPENGIIILKIQASAPQTVPAVATIVLEVQHTETPPTPTLPDPVFAEPFYTATLISNNELESGTPISLAEGYDSSVILDLEGDGSQWFDLERSANSARLILRTSNPIPPSVVASREQLVFVVTAQRPESAVAQATVIVTWREETTTDRVLGFDRVNYLGSLTEDTVNLQPITLRDGFGTDVRFTLHGDLQQHFTHVEQGDSVFVRLEKPIPAQSLPENGIIILKIQASAPQTVPAVATIVLEVQHTETPPTPTLPDPVFAEPFYTATLISNNELESGTPISLAEGYDSSVILDLEGDGSQWFDLERSANSARLILRTSNPIPPSVVASREQLVFVVTAQRPESAVARATVIVTWREETTTDRVLGFDRVNYLGSLTEDTVNLQPITLRDGFGTDVRFTLHGDLQQHFTHVEQGDTVFVRLEKPIPAQSLPENGIIILKIQASAPQTVPAVATIVLEVQHTETPPTPTLPDPVFAEPFYTATLISNNELESGTPISLAEGYDSSVILDLEGDGSQWFDLERSANSARLILRTSNPIPPSVVASREQLVFVVTAQRPESAVARATVIVTWREETTTDRVLGFDRVNYLGSLTEDTVNLQPITLRDGFGTDVRFTLHGDLQQHFTHVEQGDSVFVRLEKPIPAQSLPENGIIILKIQASAPQTVPAVATIVLEVQHTETPPTPTLPDPVFAEPFYTATLISNNELESGTPISLAEGYDSSVILDLEGDGSQWFDLERSANSARLILRTSNPIPPSVVASREQLVFVVTAQRPESAVARATVIVTWREETTTDRVLGFDRVNYLGSLTEDTVNLQPITLRDGFGTDVRFTLHGDLQQHFTHVEQGDTVFVRLEKPIPAQSLPENGIIILKIQASAPQTVPAVATIVLEVQHTETPPTPTLPDPVFAEPFYTATLISNNELESGTPISLAEGYDSSVILDLEGDGSQWFDLERSANSARLILRTSNPIPPSVVASREQLVFVVTAQRPESAVARATVIVTWREETTTDRVLGFDRVNYLGSLTEDTVNLQPITLRDGFGTDVRFTLHGDLQQHFTHVEQGDSVFVRLEKPIPAQSLPENGIIILKIQASAPQTVPAVATIVLEVQHTETPPTPTLPDPVFAEPFYTATLISNNELESGTPISLAEGYDSSVILDLEGDGSQWFDLERSANSARLILRTSNPIPPSVVASREQLVFVVTAQRPESAVARATVIVTWREETTTDRVLGFDRVNYLGSLTEDTVNLQPITLRDGFGTDVRFTLHGDLQQHFTHVEQGDTVFVRLEKPIPAQSLPENGIIILKIQASAPQTVPAVATIVLEVQHTETPPTPTLPDPVFAEPFYTATLISNNELESGTPILLAEGYDSSVILDLEGDGSQWFDLERSANSARLILRTSNPIPPSVVASREQLVFVVTAQRPESAVARATVIVTWREETTTDRVLGFDRVNYLGSLTDDTVNLQPITLRDGFGTDVRFTLHGDLQQHFTHVEQGDSVFVRLEKPIPAQSLPENGIIILKIQASAPQTVPAVATIVLEVQHTETPPTPTLPDPVFAEPFYTATLISNNELESGTPISLAEGYDSSVILDLEGDGSQWFDLERSANSARLILRTSNPIPPSVVASREQLVFVVTAQRPESAVARATVIVTWREETTTDRVLGFDRVNYLGSLTEDTVNLQPITLRDGFGTDVGFTLHGDLQQHFTHVEQGDSVFVRLEKPIPAQSLPENGIIILKIQASAPQTVPAVATIVLEVQHTETPPTPTLPDPVFAKPFYTATLISNNELESGTPISFAEGYDSSVILDLEGDGSQWFDLERSANSARLILRTSNPIPPSVVASREQLVFVVTAQRPESAVARATVIVTWREETTTDRVLGFDRVNYLGSLTEDTVNLQPITLRDGFGTDVGFTLHGDLQQHFTHVEQGDSVFVRLEKPIPAQSLPENGIIILKIQASAPQTVPAVATIVLEVQHTETPPTPTLPDPVFAEPFYTATLISNNELESGTPISFAEGYDSSVILDLEGDGSQWFDLERSANSARLILRTSNPIPPSVVASREQLVFVVTAQRPESAVAQATVIVTWREESPVQPATSVTFDSASYVLRVDVSQTGVVGQVRASADNGERIIYSLELVNEHLRSRISVNSDGDLRLSAPADSGVYNFKVVATAAFSSVKATTSVHLSVDALTVCGDEPAIAPLIVLNRDEEQPLRDLVLLNPTEHKGCRYSLTNRWPVDQKWLYVDDSGLHSTAIDREDPSIAFMALSQVQVELTLNCDSDVSRTKRFIDERLNRLGSYGTNTWLLGETIRFNRRRSIVNLIVNDINDNAPIFAEDEIIVGYPVLELEQTVLPRSLAELKATDADVGENAALVYWSSEPQLAVSPTTGFVHVRNEQQLEQDQILTVNVTDLNGNGHTGSINLMVKLLDASNIAVVTVRDAFLEDEGRILGNISSTIGYGVRSLRSVVISETEGEQVSRKKREVVTTEATLQMFVYGLAQREPVSVERLKTDIGEASVETVYIASIQTLDDHMESIVIRDSGHDVGLLVATIILSVLLFLLILAIIIWFLLKRRKKNYYDEFSDENSLASQNETLGQLPKPLDAATALAKPRLNIEELKRSEKRLQDLLNAPIEEITVEPTSSKADIVIQDKLKNIAEESDEDEYGETKIPRGRKSVVTFNENVEKIIHVDETADKSNPDYEVYRL